MTISSASTFGVILITATTIMTTVRILGIHDRSKKERRDQRIHDLEARLVAAEQSLEASMYYADRLKVEIERLESQRHPLPQKVDPTSDQYVAFPEQGKRPPPDRSWLQMQDIGSRWDPSPRSMA